MFPIKEVEKGVLSLLKNNTSSTIYNLWFSDIRVEEIVGGNVEGKIIFSVPNEFKKKVLLEQFKDRITSAIRESCGYPFPFDIIVKERPAQADPSEENEADGKEDVKKALPPEFDDEDDEEKNTDIGPDIESPNIIKQYTFDTFIVGDSNRFAHAACVAVAARSNDAYNPLFIYGQSGLGKTHLLYAITNKMKENNPNIRIVYKKGEEFTNELIACIHGGSYSPMRASAFRDKYRNCDVLLIDDIQFIAGKESTQEEFFHTFSALYEEGKQIILTSDRPPKEIKTLEERLLTRFEWGLIADIQPPSFELRVAIIRKKAEKLHIALTPDMIDYMAERLKNNIRQIEGAIKKLAAYTLLSGEELTDEKLQNVVAEFTTGTASPEEIVQKILTEVSKKYGVSVEDIKSKKRSDSIAMARHISIYLMRHMTDYSFSKISSFFNRDHTTIISSNVNIEGKLKTDSVLESEINELMNLIGK